MDKLGKSRSVSLARHYVAREYNLSTLVGRPPTQMTTYALCHFRSADTLRDPTVHTKR